MKYNDNYVKFNKEIIIDSVGLSSIILLCFMLIYGIISQIDFNINLKNIYQI